jgi:hypothetical protein
MRTGTQPFNTRLVVGLIALGLAAFAALLLLFAFGGGVSTGGGDGRAHALSGSATGFRGIVQLAGHFRRTEMVRSPDELRTEDLLVVVLEERNRPEDVAQLLQMRQGLATLLILPKWVTVPDRQRRGWVRVIGPAAGMGSGRLIGNKAEVDVRPDAGTPDRLAFGQDLLNGLEVPVPGHVQTISGNFTPLLTVPNGNILVARIGDQPHYVAADPDLFNNYGLHDPARARAALRMLDAFNSTGSRTIYFDLTLNGLSAGSSRNLLRTAFEPPFLPMTLALIAAALLAGLHGAFRFGQARSEGRAIAFGKAALVENSAGLIRLAKREARLGGAYADVVRSDAARLVGAPPALHGDALDAYLDRLPKAQGEPFSALAARLAAARDRHALIAAARALFSWKKDIIR